MDDNERVRVLTINPGATSTKLGLFQDTTCLAQEIIRHEFAGQPALREQLPERLELIRKFLSACDVEGLDAVVGRGGLLPPLRAGTYRVCEDMIADLEAARRGEHASNLGAILAREIAQDLSIPAFIVDPVSVDELSPIARISGLAGVERESLLHALNIRAVAHRYAREIGRPLGALRLVLAHLGTGVSMAAMVDGRLVDVINPRDEGPFGLDRPGALPNKQLVDLCFDPEMNQEQVNKILLGNGGVFSYLGTRDLREMLALMESGDEEARLLFDAMTYDSAKWIAAMASVLEGRLDAILLTGGMAHSPLFIDALQARIAWLAPVKVFPGEDELQAMAEGALRVLRGDEVALRYR